MTRAAATPTARDALLGAVRDLYRSLPALGACNLFVAVGALAALSLAWVHPLLAPPAAVLLVGLAIDLLLVVAVGVVERGAVGVAMLPSLVREVRVRRALAGGAVVVLVPSIGAVAVATYVRLGSPLGIALAAAVVWIAAIALALVALAWPGSIAAARAGRSLGLRPTLRASMLLLLRGGVSCIATLAGVALVLLLAASLVVPLAAFGVAFGCLAVARLVAAPLEAPVAERYDVAAA